MEVREAVPGDRPLVEAGWTGQLDVIRAHLDRSGPEATLLIAWDGDTPPGMGVLWPRCSGVHAKAAHPGAAELAHLWVAPEARGRGTGSAIVEQAERVALRRGHHELALGVADDNPDAARLYERLGFRRTGVADSCTYSCRDDDGALQMVTEHDELLVKELTATVGRNVQ